MNTQGIVMHFLWAHKDNLLVLGVVLTLVVVVATLIGRYAVWNFWLPAFRMTVRLCKEQRPAPAGLFRPGEKIRGTALSRYLAENTGRIYFDTGGSDPFECFDRSFSAKGNNVGAVHGTIDIKPQIARVVYKIRYGPCLVWLALCLTFFSQIANSSILATIIVPAFAGGLMSVVMWNAVRKGRRAVAKIIEQERQAQLSK